MRAVVDELLNLAITLVEIQLKLVNTSVDTFQIVVIFG
jgi:hypothetical protein